MSALHAASSKSANSASECDEPSSPVGSIIFEGEDCESENGDPSSSLFKIARGISWRNMNIYIDLLEHEKERSNITWKNVNQCIDILEDERGSMKIQSNLLNRTQTCTNVQCDRVNDKPCKQNSKKPRRSSIEHKKQKELPPRRLSLAGSMMKKVSSIRNIMCPQEPPIPKVIVLVKDESWTIPTLPKVHRKEMETASPTSVLPERPKFSRQSSSTRWLSIPSVSTVHGRPRLFRHSSSARKLTNLYDL
jgi:hypothetical protein